MPVIVCRPHRLRAWLGAALAAAACMLALLGGADRAWAQAGAASQVSASYQHIEQLIAQGRFGPAIEAADRYLAGNSRDPQVRFLKGVAQTGAGQTEAATATFIELTRVYPELPEPYNNLAAIYAQQGDHEKARDALLQAIRANPAYGVAHENLGDIYVQLAIQQYLAAQRLDAGNTRLAPKLRMARQLLLAAPQP